MLSKEMVLGTLNQALIYLTPLISIPIVYSALGEKIYSEIIFIQALAALILVLSEFGFSNYLIKNFCGSESGLQDNAFGSIVLIRLCITILLIFVAVIVLFTTDRLGLIALLLFIPLVCCFDCGALSIVKGSYDRFGLLLGCSKLLYIFLLLILVKSEEDLITFVVISVFHQLPFFLVIHKPVLNLKLNQALTTIKGSFHYFLPKLNQNIYLNIPVLANEFVGASLSNSAVGIPQKIFNSCTMILNPISSLIFRDMTLSYKKEKINRLIMIGTVGYFFIGIILHKFSYLIFDFLIGDSEVVPMAGLFQMLVLFLPFMAFNMLLGSSVLLANGKNKVVILSSFIALLFTVFLLSLNEVIGNDLKFVALLILSPKIIELIIRFYSAIKMRLIF
jgi:PST family polysaccharide transporter